MLAMLMRTFRKGLPFVVFLALLTAASTNLWGKARGIRDGDSQENARLKVSVYNDAQVPADVLKLAENEASRIFRQAGIELYLLNCRIPAVSEGASRACREAVFPEHLHLRIVRKSLGLKGETLGISFQSDDGSGCYADLFYEPMEQLHRSNGADLASLLGHVAAHEIGHLLLGANSHSSAGIMHVHWTAEELTSARVGGLVFSESESRRMRARLATAMQASKEAPLSAGAEVPARTD